MATITLRVDDQVRDQLQMLAESNGLSLSDLLRSLIDGLLDEDGHRQGPRRRALVPESISAVDRKQLALLHKILARVVEDRRDDDRLGRDGDTAYQLDRAQALEEGWTMEYDMEFYSMEPELSRRDCGLVLDLLDMFRILKYSMARIPDGELSEDTAWTLTFSGFDANDEHESRLLQYARWIVSDGDRWQEQAEVFSSANDRGNSHMPRLGAYQRMLEAYQPIWRSTLHRSGRRSELLSADELREIAAAAVHPTRRNER